MILVSVYYKFQYIRYR